MIAKIKLFTAVIAVLVLVIIIQMISSQIRERKHQRVLEELHQMQVLEIEKATQQYTKQIDSMQNVIAIKQEHISALEISLQNNLHTATKINTQYEVYKKHAQHINHADSLYWILSKRYQNTRHR
ncbi:hypothetical protein [Aquimarina latercula]|uniref:hypothetical protein n=1 Tax=Aquimarina latercula TaxID=987 RepID=UPI0004856886|nr:hypothetical protein [Aquimarina latercula]